MDIDDKLIEACENGDLSAVKKCVEQGANIHAWGDEPLRYAANNGHLEVVKYLIESGVDIHAWGDRALRYATYYGHLQVANVLRKAAGDKYKCHRCIIKSTCLDLCEDFKVPLNQRVKNYVMTLRNKVFRRS